MPGAEILFDTNALTAWLRDADELFGVLSKDVRPAVPVIVLRELFYGIGKSSHAAENRLLLERALKGMRVIAPDFRTAEIYGDVCLKLRMKGRPIPTNDMWIAAIALQHNLDLLTRDAHFQEIDALNIVGW
jgi:tRNA(fMet)-specific endonuclease VapC